MPRTCFFIITSLLALIHVQGSFAREVDWESRLRNEAPAQWRSYLGLEERMAIECEVIAELNPTPDQGEPTTQRTTFRLFGRGASRILEMTEESGVTTAVVHHEGRYFAVERPAEASEFQVRYRGDDPALFEANYSENAAIALLPVKIPHLENLSFEELIQSPRCTITSVTAERDGSSELVRVDFDYEPGERSRFGGGTLWLDPQRHWLLDHGTLYPKNRLNQFTFAIQYGEEVGGLPSIRLLTIKHTISNRDKPARVVKATFDRWERPEVPEERFTLAAYGIRGANEAPLGSKTPRAHRWWLAAGAALAVLAVGMRVARFRVGRAATQS